MDLANSNLNRLPIRDGSNYDLWKTRIRSHIKSIDIRVWRSVIDGYVLHLLPPDVDKDLVAKLECDYTDRELAEANNNEKALNIVFSYVNPHMFKLIRTCTTAQNARDILQRHCEEF